MNHRNRETALPFERLGVPILMEHTFELWDYVKFLSLAGARYPYLGSPSKEINRHLKEGKIRATKFNQL
jgi:hypothetical protein